MHLPISSIIQSRSKHAIDYSALLVNISSISPKMGSHILIVYVTLYAHLLSPFVYSAAISAGTVIMDEKPVLLRGRQGDLQCIFSESPVAIYWLKGDTYGSSSNLITWHNGNVIYHGHEGAYFIDEGYSLIINNVTDEDAGKYHCRVSTVDGIILYNTAEVTVKVPPTEMYPTIDECSNSSMQPCSLDVGDRNHTTTITCRTEGATIGLVSLNWTHECSHNLSEPRRVSSPNQDGETENIASTITVEDCQGVFSCNANVDATRVEPKDASIYVYFTIGETSTIKSITDVIPQKWTNVVLIAVIVIVLLLAVVLMASIKCYCHNTDPSSSGRSNIEMTKRECHHHRRQGLILYWDLWMLVNLKPEDETYLEKLNEMVAHLRTEEDEHKKDVTINSLYQQLCEWKKACAENAQEKRLGEAMKNNGLRDEYQQIKELRENTTNAELAEDFSHICWWLRDIGRTVTVEGDYLSFHYLSKQSEEHEMKEFNFDSLLEKEIETFRTWKEEFIRRHCRHPINGSDDENDKLINKDVTKPLNPNMELCRALEEAGLKHIAQTMYLIPDKYKRLSDDDMKTFAMHITERHCNIIGVISGLKQEKIMKRNSENLLALFDTAAMLKKCSRRYGNYALRCKLRKIAEKLGRSEEMKDTFIDHASSVIYQPPETTEFILENKQPDTSSESDLKATQESEAMQSEDEPSSNTDSEKLSSPKIEEYLPLPLQNKRVYNAEVVPVAYCILLDDILPFAEGLGIGRNQLDQFRPPRNNLHKGTSGLLLNLLAKCKKDKKKKETTRSRFADVLRTAGFGDAAKLITHDYELSMTVLKPILTKVESSKIVRPDNIRTVFNVSRQAIERWQTGDVWQVMKEWKTKLRPEPFSYRLELEQALKDVGLDDKSISVLLGQGTKKPSRPSDDVLKNLINDAGSDEVWKVIHAEWCSDSKTKPSINIMAPLIHGRITLKNKDSGRVSLFDFKSDIEDEIQNRINKLFLEGLFDLAYEYAVWKRVDT